MNRFYLFLFTGLMAWGCSPGSEKENLNLATQESFVHLVFLNVKEDLTDDESDVLFKEINRLGEIENVQSFKIGFFQDVGDKRALAAYEMTLQMIFSDRSQYDLYQLNPLHDEVKKQTGQFLEGPPVTYDYVIR